MMVPTRPILDVLRRANTSGHPATDFVVRGIWKHEGYSWIDELSSEGPGSKYAFLLVLTSTGLGCCYCEEDVDLPAAWIGRDARELRCDNPYLDIARLDAVHSGITHSAPSVLFTLDGAPRDKALQRSAIVASEVMALAEAMRVRTPRVVMFGVVARIVKELSRRGAEVSAVDLQPSLIGETIDGVVVRDRTRSDDLMRDSDVALITGMTIANGTLEGLLERARDLGTKTVIYAETGASFGPTYRRLGVDVVVSESFPFYITPGPSDIRIYKAEQ